MKKCERARVRFAVAAHFTESDGDHFDCAFEKKEGRVSLNSSIILGINKVIVLSKR